MLIDKDLLSDLILSTDMAFHYEHLKEANALDDILSSVNLWDQDNENGGIEFMSFDSRHS